MYQVKGQFYSPLNWSYWTETNDVDSPQKLVQHELQSFLAEFEPDLFVNLFDNVYSIQKRISEYPFRLIELLRWRNVEMLMTDIVSDMAIPTIKRTNFREVPRLGAHYRYERSPIVAKGRLNSVSLKSSPPQRLE